MQPVAGSERFFPAGR